MNLADYQCKTNNLRQLKHIAVCGNIGAGKTTLCGKLAQHYGWDVRYEEADNNPYLDDFYHDMKRWSFNLQVYFLNSRYSQLLEIQNGDRVVIQDRTIYEDAYIFAPNLFEMGLMEQRDFNNYFSLFKSMVSQIEPPDLLIYLQAGIPTLVSHIQERGRDYEGSMSLDYLRNLNERYENWIKNYTEGNKLIINIDDLDLKNNPEDFSKVLERIDSQIHGLFEPNSH
ncbi:MAG: deoxyadenosine/deoxycytidine kinase [Saprospiraceae bacterium]|jgi:deoxyadenosine/deoxycytidine kinase